MPFKKSKREPSEEDEEEQPIEEEEELEEVEELEEEEEPKPIKKKPLPIEQQAIKKEVSKGYLEMVEVPTQTTIAFRESSNGKIHDTNSLLLKIANDIEEIKKSVA